MYILWLTFSRIISILHWTNSTRCWIPFFLGQHCNEFHNSFILQPAPPQTRFRVGVQMHINIWWACTHPDASYNDIRKHNKRETHHVEEWQGNKRLTSCQHISSKHENSKWGGCNLKKKTKKTIISIKNNKRSEHCRNLLPANFSVSAVVTSNYIHYRKTIWSTTCANRRWKQQQQQYQQRDLLSFIEKYRPLTTAERLFTERHRSATHTERCFTD